MFNFAAPEEVQPKLPERREAIARAESEIGNLCDRMTKRSLNAIEAELSRQELKTLLPSSLFI